MSDIERIWVPRRPISRRRMLQGMAGAGAATALAACGGGAASPSTVAPTAAPATPGASAEPTDEPSAEPTPVPEPEGELFIYNWADYIGEDTISKFESQTGVKVTYTFFDSAETMNATINAGNSGHDVTFPTSTYL